MIKKSIIILIILLVNGITNTTAANLILTIPQIIFVLYFIVNGKLDKAIFWHFIFFVTSYSYFGDLDGYTESSILTSYNYAKFKFVGPVSYSLILAVILMTIVNIKSKVKDISLFSDLYRLLLFFIITGFGLGLIGLIFKDYYMEGVLTYGSYIIIIFIHANILISRNSSSLRKEFRSIIVPLLAFPPIVSYIIHLINPQLIDSTGLAFFSVLLLPAILFQKKIGMNILGLVFLIYNMIMFQTSGKQIICLLLVVLITLGLSFSKTGKSLFPKRAHLLRIFFISFIIAIPTISIILYNTYGGSTYIVSKIYQVQSLAFFLLGNGDVSTIAASPYVRVTSLINIVYEGLKNPIILLFGNGYGGYFQDHFNYFSSVNLYGGAFPDNAILAGKYYTGHDTIVTVPMFNGFIGLFLLLKVTWKCIIFSKKNFLILSAIPFLLLAFYFNTLIGVSGVLLFYLGSENLYKSNLNEK